MPPALTISFRPLDCWVCHAARCHVDMPGSIAVSDVCDIIDYMCVSDQWCPHVYRSLVLSSDAGGRASSNDCLTMRSIHLVDWWFTDVAQGKGRGS